VKTVLPAQRRRDAHVYAAPHLAVLDFIWRPLLRRAIGRRLSELARLAPVTLRLVILASSASAASPSSSRRWPLLTAEPDDLAHAASRRATRSAADWGWWLGRRGGARREDGHAI